MTDAKGRKTAVVIDFKKHGALWEDIEDVLVSRSRRHERRIPFAKVKAASCVAKYRIAPSAQQRPLLASPVSALRVNPSARLRQSTGWTFRLHGSPELRNRHVRWPL